MITVKFSEVDQVVPQRPLPAVVRSLHHGMGIAVLSRGPMAIAVKLYYCTVFVRGDGCQAKMV